MDKQQEPRLRFKGFTGAWKEQKIIEIADYVDYRGKTPRKTEEGIFLITAKNVKMGSLDYKVSQEFIAIEDFESVMSRGKAEIGDVLITTEAPLGNVAQIDREDVALAQRVIKYRGIKGILNNDFLTQKFLTNTFQATLGSLSSGGTVQGIKGSLLHQIEIKYPSLPEQTHLSLFFRRLDSQIAESRAVLEKSRQLKKAMLAKMFPANGEKIPKIRFKGFEGEWETYQICDLFRITRGNVLATTNLVDNKNEDYCYPVYSSQTKNKGLMGYWKHYLFENAITWTTDGANAGDVNFRSGKFYCTNVCGVLINEEGFANQCIAEILNLVTPSYVSYVGNPKLMNNVMAEIPILIPPTIKEQTAIGNFFRQLDETIALQSAEVEKLNQLKKGLLTAMLV